MTERKKQTKAKAQPKMLRCAYKSRETGQCMNTFPERGPKRYCSQRCQVRAHQVKSGRHLKGSALRKAAIERDGGCVRCEPPVEEHDEERDDTEQDPYEAWLNAEYPTDRVKQRLLVRIVDTSKPRSLDNVETLCTKHFAKASASRHRERVGAVAFKAAKHAQGVERMVIRRLRKKLDKHFGKDKWVDREAQAMLS